MARDADCQDLKHWTDPSHRACFERALLSVYTSFWLVHFNNRAE